MAKKIEIQVAVGCIHHNGAEYKPGERLSCSSDEATWLVSIGVARYPETQDTPKTPAAHDPPANDPQVILAAIAAAENPVQLAALMPEDDPGEEIKAAFEAKMAELEK